MFLHSLWGTVLIWWGDKKPGFRSRPRQNLFDTARYCEILISAPHWNLTITQTYPHIYLTPDMGPRPQWLHIISTDSPSSVSLLCCVAVSLYDIPINIASYRYTKYKYKDKNQKWKLSAFQTDFKEVHLSVMSFNCIRLASSQGNFCCFLTRNWPWQG